MGRNMASLGSQRNGIGSEGCWHCKMMRMIKLSCISSMANKRGTIIQFNMPKAKPVSRVWRYTDFFRYRYFFLYHFFRYRYQIPWNFPVPVPNFTDTGTYFFLGPKFSGTGTIQRGAKFLGPECHSLLIGLCSHVKNLPHSFTLWHPLLPGGLEWSHICTICTYGSRWFTTVL